jgi:uncharacterized membrane protein
MYALLFAILSPIIWALAYIYDKYVLVHRERNPLRYGTLIGIANVAFAAGLALFLDWSGVSLGDFLFPILAGALLAADTFLYLIIMQKEDVAEMVGLMYTYPLLVALLSFLFLGERISLFGYIGVLLILLGAVLLSVRVRRVRLRVGAWLIVANIILVALTEFFAKVSTSGLSAWQGFAVNNIAFGAVLIAALMLPSVRQGFSREFRRNIGFAFIGEIFTVGAVLTMYLAMAEMPATIVSALQALQAFAIIIFERIASHFFGGMEKDHLLLPKLTAIVIIVIGVLVLYLTA